MGSLYDIQVMAVEDDHIDLFVNLLHVYLGGYDQGKTFALRLLWDPTDEYSYGKEQSVRESPLAREMDLDNYLSEAWIDANAQGFIESVEILDDSFEEDSITCTMRITVTHPGWIAHMREGMSWDTAAYGWNDGDSWEGRPKRRPGDHVEEVSDDPMEGMRLRQNDDKTKAMLKGTDATELILANHGAKQYTIKDKLEGDALTLDAVRALAGQPVLVQGGYRLEVGTVVNIDDENGYFQIYHESGNSSGASGYNPNGIEFMGRAWFVRRISVEDIEV